MKLYVVPAITDNKILPTDSIPSQYISDKIALSGCRGQYISASFVVQSDTEELTDLIPEASELTGESGSIPSANIDIRVIKCWYQASGSQMYFPPNTPGKALVPELLLRDDSLVKIEGEENYLKLTTGEYRWISEIEAGTEEWANLSVADLPVKDSLVLQPVDIPLGTNKQFWIRVQIPETSPPGLYSGKIELRTPAGLVGELQLELQVLPIELLDSYLPYSIFYFSVLQDGWPDGSISARAKSQEQLRAEMKNLFDHGVTNPNIFQWGIMQLGAYMATRAAAGFDTNTIYSYWPYNGVPPPGYDYQYWVNLYKSYGATECYFYGKRDEPRPEHIEEVRAHAEMVHAAGGKVFLAFSRHFLSEEQIGSLADVIDLAILGPGVGKPLIDTYHSYGHQVFAYSTPMGGMEKPETQRRNYGLLLWQRGFDGAMNWPYQQSYGKNIWNDFDHVEERDFVFAYPTIDGVVDTIQWEGFREGVNDVRYLTTLLRAIDAAKAEGKDTSLAENYLANLKTADLSTKNLDQVRHDMVDHILYLQGEPVEPPPAPSPSAHNLLLFGVIITMIAGVILSRRRS